MKDIFITVLSLSFYGTVLFLIIYILKKIIYRFFSKGLYFYIWIIVLLRFIIPFSIPVTIYLNNDLNVSNIQTVDKSFIIDDTIDNTYKNEITIKNKKNIDITNKKNVIIYFSFIWIFVAVVIILKKIIVYNKFVKILKNNIKQINFNNDLLVIYENVCNEINIKNKPKIFMCHLIASPIQVGLVCPLIIIPKSFIYEQSRIKYIFMHELTHYKHFDILYKWFSEIILTIYWFNPFSYLIRREINILCELYCDESVVKNLNIKEKKDYANMIIESIEKTKFKCSSIVSFSANAKIIKERLVSIMNYNKKLKCISIFPILILCVAASFTSVFAKKNVENPDLSNIDTLSYTGITTKSEYWEPASGIESRYI